MRIRKGAAKRTVLALTTLAMVVTLAACSGDDGDSGDEPGPSPEDPPMVVSSVVAIGEVSGRLPRVKQDEISAEVGEVVVDWIEAAYFFGSPRTELDQAFPGFTTGAARLARRDKWLMSNAALAGNIEEVVPAGDVKVAVDMLAVKGRVAGATARFNVVFDTVGAKTRRVTVRGRLALTRNDDGDWTVFAYDAGRFDKAPKGDSQMGADS